MTRIYFDTEFSSLTTDAALISLGAVAEDGREYYVELDPLPLGCSEFVRAHILPLLTGPTIPRTEFAAHFAAWLGQFQDPILVSDSTWDLAVLRLALGHIPDHTFGEIELAGQTVALIPLPPIGEEAAERYDAAQAAHYAKDPRPHHALVDARALAAGVAAIEQGAI